MSDTYLLHPLTNCCVGCGIVQNVERKNRIGEVGIMKSGRKSKYPVWRDEELCFVREAHLGKDPSAVSLVRLSECLGREYDDVKSRCTLLGLRRSNGCMVVRDRDEAYMKRMREMEG